MTRTVAVCALLFLIAGCVGPPAPGGEPLPTAVPTSAASSALPFLAPTTVWRDPDVAIPQSEAFVAVSPDGQTILSCAHGVFQRPARMFASTDGGATFRELTATPTPGISGDCEVAMGPDGTWYFLHSTVESAAIATTSDKGATWSVNHAAVLPTNGMADRPWIDVVGRHVYLTYMPQFNVPGPLGFTKSTDRGRTWSLPQRVAEMQPGKTNVYQGHMILGPDENTIRVPLVRFTPGSPAFLELAVSRDAGATWSLLPVAGPLSDFRSTWPVAAMDGLGRLYWAYGLVNGTRTDVVLAVSGDDGRTWSRPVPVLRGVQNAGTMWMDGRADGTVDLLVHGDATNVQKELVGRIVLRLDASRSDPVAQIGTAAPGRGEFSAIDHDAAGRAYVVGKVGDAIQLIREDVAADASSPIRS